MHPAAETYVGRALDKLRFDSTGLDIVEIGSLNVNGSIRGHFQNANSYVGVDVRSGPDVDVVADGAAFGKPHCCDVVICCETLEHAPDPEAIVRNAARILKPSGLFIMTAAAHDRDPHSVDGAELPKGQHYGNIGRNDLEAWLASSFDKHSIEENARDRDIYCCAWRAAK